MRIAKTTRTKGALLAIVTVITAALIYFMVRDTDELPIYNPIDFNPELVDNGLQNIKEGHIVSDFSLINQDGDTISQRDYEGKIYVVDFFFTRCPSICPIMANNMGKLQRQFANDKDVALLSVSVTPEFDSIPVLRAYAVKNGAMAPKWNITTGEKTHIYTLARKSYFAAVDEGDGGMQDFIHTPNFVLVDKDRRIRGVYNGTNDKEMERVALDIKQLQNN